MMPLAWLIQIYTQIIKIGGENNPPNKNKWVYNNFLNWQRPALSWNQNKKPHLLRVGLFGKQIEVNLLVPFEKHSEFEPCFVSACFRVEQSVSDFDRIK